MFFLAVFFSCLFFHCLQMVRNQVKKPKNQYDDKEIQHCLQLINNGDSIEMELGLPIVEIYVDQRCES